MLRGEELVLPVIVYFITRLMMLICRTLHVLELNCEVNVLLRQREARKRGSP
jgi:hypothetical protein